MARDSGGRAQAPRGNRDRARSAGEAPTRRPAQPEQEDAEEQPESRARRAKRGAAGGHEAEGSEALRKATPAKGTAALVLPPPLPRRPGGPIAWDPLHQEAPCSALSRGRAGGQEVALGQRGSSEVEGWKCLLCKKRTPAPRRPPYHASCRRSVRLSCFLCPWSWGTHTARSTCTRQ